MISQISKEDYIEIRKIAKEEAEKVSSKGDSTELAKVMAVSGDTISVQILGSYVTIGNIKNRTGSTLIVGDKCGVTALKNNLSNLIATIKL